MGDSSEGIEAGVSETLEKTWEKPAFQGPDHPGPNASLLEHLSRCRFFQFAATMDSIVWMSTLDGTQILYVNDAYERIFGRSTDSLLHHGRSWLEAVYPEDREEVLKTFPEGMREECSTMNYRILRPDGTTCWIRARGFPVRDEEGETVFLAGLAEDVTEERKREQESASRFQASLQEEKFDSLREVVAGLAHEINNPNSFISYNVPLLEQTWNLVAPIVEAHALRHPDGKAGNLPLSEICRDMKDIIADIKTGSDRINMVVSNLKDLAKIDSKGHSGLVSVNQVVNKALLIVGFQIKRLVKRIDLKLGPDLPKVEGYAMKLEQVVANLLLNAAHAIEDKDRGRISVTTRYVERHGAVLIDIADNGRGMLRETVQRIYDPFFTTRRTSGGTGLGLPISRTLIEEHAGVLTMLTRPGFGTRFTVYLPTDQTVSLDVRPTILCVDDDATFLGILSAHFTNVKQCHMALNDPKEALAFLDQHPEVYLVLSDLVMSNLSGWELLRSVKERCPLLPFILYSGYPTEFVKKPAGVPPPDYFLGRPFRFDFLTKIIDEIAISYSPPPREDGREEAGNSSSSDRLPGSGTCRSNPWR